MTIQAATPYSTLAGQAEEAIARYQQALGATDVQLRREADRKAT